jgi:uncharacterized protein
MTRPKVALARRPNGIKAGLIAATALFSLPGVAVAQFSDSYNFLKAIRDADGTKVTELINKPGSIIVDTRDGSTGEAALHIVTKRRDTAFLSFLLARGAKADIRDKQGNTALMIASQLRFVEGANILIDHRASVDLTNGNGETPLIKAVQNRDLAMVRLLLTAGANPKKADTIAGYSALDYATKDTRTPALLKALQEAKPIKPKSGPTL